MDVPDSAVQAGRRRGRRFRGGGALTAGVLAFRTDSQRSSPRPSAEQAEKAAGKGQSREEWVVCATTIAVGDVVAVQPGAERGRLSVTFSVREWIKPAHGAQRIRIDAVDPRTDGVQDPWEVGQHLLVVVPQRRDEAVSTFSGRRLAEFRPHVEKGLLGAEGTPCPSPWRAGDQ
ncbi:hypothetical protein H9Y04_19745 [Streptomyces sp. TRM66268-LWL]|uniref:Uncharacterized protein n=1 Tax=Streptomyces polyasparticus TaxID=2767826 RepID=A0ABR7SIW2_9ACTN|nr:hypothetical protein [Streptomyces polyasparticus]MBC9714789.1 hypothetical protein [Streptomyces polyasparticus]